MNLWTGRSKLIGCEEIDRGQYNNVQEVAWVVGVAMLVKSNVFRQIGFFDETFFLCYEENDFCHRTRKQGFKILSIPEAKIWHKAEWVKSKPNAEYYLIRNRLLFMRKNAKIWHFFSFFYFYILGTLVRLISYLLGNDTKSTKLILRGIVHGFNLITDKSIIGNN